MSNELTPDEYDQTFATLQSTMDKFLDAARVEAVYGEPVAYEDHLIIPTAEVLSLVGFGMGSGSGTGPNPENPGAGMTGGEGAGGGGGGRVLSRPVAVIIAAPEGVRVEPVVDVTKIGLAALTAAGFMFGMWLRMMRPRV